MSEAIYYALDKLMIVATIASLVMWIRVLVRPREHSVSLVESFVPARVYERPFWSLADALVMFGTQIVLMTLLHVTTNSLGWSPSSDADPDLAVGTNAQLVNLGIVVGAALGSIAITLGWLRLMNDKPIQRLGLVLNTADVWLGLKAAVMLLPPVLLISALVSLLQPYRHEVLDLLQNVDSPAVFLMMFFGTAIVTPVFEELLFRVLVQGGLQGLMDRDQTIGTGSTDQALYPRSYLPIVLASLIFAAMHLGQGAAPIPLFFLSLGLGYLYRQTGNITAPLVVHIVLNALTLIVKFTESTGSGS